MELGVRLNLLCSRLDEIEPRLTALAATFEDVAAKHGGTLTAFLQALQPAVETARVAHEARLEASRTQVRLLLNLHLNSPGVNFAYLPPEYMT